jgi:hypothetical protein
MVETMTDTEAVGVFHDADDLQAALDDLQTHGFDRAELTVLAGHRAVEKFLGHDYASVAELEDAVGVPTAAFVPKESLGDAEGAVFGTLIYIPAVVAGAAVVASGGALGGAFAAAAIAGGLGGGIGAVLARLIGRHHARYLEDQLERGGLLLWVRTRTSDRERRAQEILGRHGAGDVHLHALPKLHFATEG